MCIRDSSRPMPRPAPVTTAIFPLSIMMSVPLLQSQKPDDDNTEAGGSVTPRVEGGDERGGEHEYDRGVVDEHRERDQDGQRPVDLVVEAHPLDVEPEKLLGDLPQHAG